MCVCALAPWQSIVIVSAQSERIKFIDNGHMVDWPTKKKVCLNTIRNDRRNNDKRKQKFFCIAYLGVCVGRIVATALRTPTKYKQIVFKLSDVSLCWNGWFHALRQRQNKGKYSRNGESVNKRFWKHQTGIETKWIQKRSQCERVTINRQNGMNEMGKEKHTLF